MLQTRTNVVSQVHPDCTALPFAENQKVAARLRCDHRSDTVFVAWNGQIFSCIAGQLQKNALVWAALVGLASRVQIPRTEPNAGCDVLGISNFRTHVLQ